MAETIYETDDHHPPPTSSTLTTFAVLVVLAIIALAVGFSNMGPAKVFASLGVAVVQSVILALYFMDLKQADKLTWLVAAAAVFWTGLMFLFTLTDYLTRYMAAY